MTSRPYKIGQSENQNRQHSRRNSQHSRQNRQHSRRNRTTTDKKSHLSNTNTRKITNIVSRNPELRTIYTIIHTINKNILELKRNIRHNNIEVVNNLIKSTVAQYVLLTRNINIVKEHKNILSTCIEKIKEFEKLIDNANTISNIDTNIIRTAMRAIVRVRDDLLKS